MAAAFVLALTTGMMVGCEASDDDDLQTATKPQHSKAKKDDSKAKQADQEKSEPKPEPLPHDRCPDQGIKVTQFEVTGVSCADAMSAVVTPIINQCGHTGCFTYDTKQFGEWKCREDELVTDPPYAHYFFPTDCSSGRSRISFTRG